MSKKTEAAWAKIRDGQSLVGYLQENTRGTLGLYAQRLSEGVPDEELGKIAYQGAVAFRALSQACALAARGSEELVEMDPFHMNRRQAYFMGQAAGQRHYFGYFAELSTAFSDLARFHGAPKGGNLERDAKEFSDRVLEANRRNAQLNRE